MMRLERWKTLKKLTMPKKLSEDEKLARWAKRLQKAADKAYAEGRISHFDYRDISFKALEAAKPRAFVRVIGLRF